MTSNNALSPFTFESRYNLCTQCGAVLPVPLEGGHLSCGSCGRALTLSARDTRPIHQASPHPVTPDAQRLQAMRAQDGRPMQTPAGLQSLVIEGHIPDWKLSEAFAAWQSSRQELVATGSFDAAERLAYLTMFLPQFGPDLAPIQQRAFYESALEIMNIPRHRQLVLGQLARTAARHNDLSAAESWLALCDPAPDDLDMDSTYRATRAFIDTKKGQWNDVIRVLGSGPDDIPIADFMDVFCGVLRANAWEKLGRVDVAAQLLAHELRRGGSTVESMTEKHRLCEQSYQQAASQHDAESAEKVAASAVGGTAGNALLFVGGTQLLVGFGLTVASVANYVGLIEQMGPAWSLSAITGPGLAGVIMVAVSVVIAGLGWRMRRKAARARYIRLHGIQARAQVTEAGRTGLRVNGVPQWQLGLHVLLPDKPPYQTTTKLIVPDAVVAQVQGQTIKVRVAPDDPSEVVLQLH